MKNNPDSKPDRRRPGVGDLVVGESRSLPRSRRPDVGIVFSGTVVADKSTATGHVLKIEVTNPANTDEKRIIERYRSHVQVVIPAHERPAYRKQNRR